MLSDERLAEIEDWAQRHRKRGFIVAGTRMRPMDIFLEQPDDEIMSAAAVNHMRSRVLDQTEELVAEVRRLRGDRVE